MTTGTIKTEVVTYVQKRLFEMQDEEYKTFHSRLMPGVDPNTVIGVRTPQLRKFAKEFAKMPESEKFLKVLPHEYYEENNLHGFLIEAMKDYDGAIEALERFFPYVNNWATCDMMSPKVFKKNLPKLREKITEWMASEAVYTVRFGIGMLMRFYLDDGFSPEDPKAVSKVKSDEYYVNMMIAWYFATALAKQHDVILPYFEERALETWTHNKAIQKAIESRRIDAEEKAYLKTLKIK